MLRDVFARGNFTPGLLVQTLYYDIDLAAKCSHRTFLDVDDWCPRVLSPMVSEVRKSIPVFRDHQEVHPNIMYPRLREIWARRKTIAKFVYQNPFPAQPWADRSLGDMAWFYIAATGFVDLGQLNNMYLDLSSGLVFIEATVAQRHLQAAHAVALEYLCRRIGSECFINGVDVRDASETLIRKLRHSYEIVLRQSTTRDLIDLADSCLWILYVGALCEQRKAKICHSIRLWFTPRLASQALLMGVTAFSQVQPIFERFLHAQFIDPDESAWFEDLTHDR